MRNLLATVLRIPASILSGAVRVYRATLSPDHGPLRHFFPHGFCRHEPTCSQYALNVLRDRNLFVAIGLTIKRILSCNPWTKPSDDRLKAVIERQS